MRTPVVVIPDEVQAPGQQEFTVQAIIDVDDQGHVTHVSLKQTTGYNSLDAALLAAWQSTPFKPRRHNGKLVAAQHTCAFGFQLDFKQ